MERLKAATHALHQRGSVRCARLAGPTAGSGRPSRSEEFWRPWLVGRRDLEQGQARIRQRLPYGAPAGKHGSYKHPVRLFWPNSRSSDHLYAAGEALLSNFPVQATIAFYEESDSESDAGSSDESCDSGIESE
ncbi:protein ripply1-like [Ambystoma mexicanum]|uniref:protein ripply1-like n=1 Tax=Ambystoma mexicanum TaxID=8296 RepID=UPI0037E92FEF